MDGSTRMTGNAKGLLQRRAGLIAWVTVLTVAAVLDAVWLSDDEASPNYPLVVGLGLLGGLAVGLLVAYLWDRHAGRLKRPRDIEEATGLPVLGVVPAMHLKGADRVAVQASDQVEGPQAYGILAAELAEALRKRGPNCLLITSPTRGTGRTTTAVNLATQVAAEGLRVALVSVDSNGEGVDEVLDLEQRPGLAQVLDGSSSLDSALQPGGVERLSVLTAGGPSDEDLGQRIDQIARMLDRLTKQVNLIVIDAPPVLGGLETVLLAQDVDLVLLVADVRHGKRSEATAALSYLGHVRESLVGWVANDPGPRRSRRPRPAPVTEPAAAPAADAPAEPAADAPAEPATEQTPPAAVPAATPAHAATASVAAPTAEPAAEPTEESAPGRSAPAWLAAAVAATGLRLRQGGRATANAIGAASASTRRAARTAGGKIAAGSSYRALRRHPLAGVIGSVLAVAMVISTVWWLSYDDPSDASHTSARTRDASLAATAAPPSSAAAVTAAMEQCRSTWDAQAEPLATAADSIDQWQVHIDAMNQLVAGKITLAQANAFWARSRIQAADKVHRFESADHTYTAGTHSCRKPDETRVDNPDVLALMACQRAIGQREDALDAARVAIGTWHHHVMDMNMMRAGTLSPTRAVKLWNQNWRLGAAELVDYRTQLRQTGKLGC
jgi:Mrp family chromosome partitioning ATPase